MRVLAFALPAVFVSLGFTHLLLAESRQRWLVWLYVVLVAANVLGNLVAIRRWSYMGAAGVTVATEGLALAMLAAYWVGRRRMPLRARSLLAVPLAVAIAALAGLALGATPPEPGAGIPSIVLRLAVATTAALALYGGGVVALRILPLGAVRSLLPGSGSVVNGSP
jgi:O-antigen/teichoic acid export membrane protein